MARSRPKSKPPSRRGTSSPAVSPVPDGALPASEIASRMQTIADQIDHLPHDLARAIAGDRDPHPQPRGTGSEVADRGLVGPASRPSTAQVVTLDAYPHPEKDGCVLIRLDGWDGHMTLTLTRDRAVLLASRLAQAVEKSHAWFDPSS